jgi:hypothetical protein
MEKLSIDQKLHILDRAVTLASCRKADEQQGAVESLYEKMVELISSEEADKPAA